MNKHNAAQYLPFVQALADGKMLEIVSNCGNWIKIDEPSFNAEPKDYRIIEPTKPMTTPTQRTPTPRVITPGKWRMRNGEVTEVVKHDHTIYVWKNPSFTISWTKAGRELDDKRESPSDLLTRVETKWRPWKPEEVPVGSVVRSKDSPAWKQLITGVSSERLLMVSSWCGPFDIVLRDWELLIPDGTYAPCGIEEEVG